MKGSSSPHHTAPGRTPPLAHAHRPTWPGPAQPPPRPSVRVSLLHLLALSRAAGRRTLRRAGPSHRPGIVSSSLVCPRHSAPRHEPPLPCTDTAPSARALHLRPHGTAAGRGTAAARARGNPSPGSVYHVEIRENSLSGVPTAHLFSIHSFSLLHSSPLTSLYLHQHCTYITSGGVHAVALVLPPLPGFLWLRRRPQDMP